MLRKWFGRKTPPTPPRADAPPAVPAPGAPVDVTDATFADLLNTQEDRLLVVDFWAEWCQPCTIMAAYVEFLTRDFPDQLRVAALDVDENPATAERYVVMGLPTLIFFRHGAEVGRVVGVDTYEELRSQVAALLGTENPTP
jgi:thioredoxin 1